MRKPLCLGSSLVLASLIASPAGAATWYVSPDGTAEIDCSTRDTPCSLTSAASGAVAGDTVILTDGVYKTRLDVANSGTEDAPITFKADECSTPIIEGPGVGPDDDDQATGVGSATASYLRFDGIVSRGWNTGFGNGWTGNQTQDSNGNWQIENCIGDMNGRTGFTFYSAGGFTLKHSISAHNGSSVAHSWSSGVTLYASPAGVIEGNVAFENIDAERHTDGSGFIADESSNDAAFVNNLAFLNGGSCLRLTKSSGVRFVNNTCYHDAQDPLATSPTNPDEIHFSSAPSDASTITDIWFANNLLVALGSGAGPMALNYTPTSGLASNITAVGTVKYFTDADGEHPDFTLAKSASEAVGKGSSEDDPPSDDLGFDPKCLVKRAPTMIGMMSSGSWWQHSIDYDYIKSIGGVAQCFHPKARSAKLDLGSYASGTVKTATPNSCTPPAVGNGNANGSGGVGGDGDGESHAGEPNAGGAPPEDESVAEGGSAGSLPRVPGKPASFCRFGVASSAQPLSMMGLAALAASLWSLRRLSKRS